MMPMQTTHGQEPTALVRAAMMEADVIFRVTSFSISNTEARRAACAEAKRQARIQTAGEEGVDLDQVHLPDPVQQQMQNLLERIEALEKANNL